MLTEETHGLAADSPAGQFRDRARDLLTRYTAQKRKIAGVGHPIHVDGDPRVGALRTVSQENGYYGKCWRLLDAIADVHQAEGGARPGAGGPHRRPDRAHHRGSGRAHGAADVAAGTAGGAARAMNAMPDLPMNFQLSADQVELQDALRRYLQSEVAPIVDEHEAQSRMVPAQVVRAMHDFGLLGGLLPEASGGFALPMTTYGMLIAEVARVWPS